MDDGGDILRLETSRFRFAMRSGPRWDHHFRHGARTYLLHQSEHIFQGLTAFLLNDVRALPLTEYT